MTTAQLKRLYFPTWRRAFDATWVWERGTLTLRPTAPASDVREMVETHAETLADREVRAVEPDDLRRAANALALQQARTFRAGRCQLLPATAAAASSKLFDGLTLDLFRALCNLIVEPLLLGTDEKPGLIWWENPQVPERLRLLNTIDRRCTPGYAGKLCLDLHGTRDYHTLDYRSVAGLYTTLRGRPGAWMMTASAPRRTSKVCV